MAKYYVKKQEIVVARQWNGSPIKNVTVRGGKGYISVGGNLVTLTERDWIVEGETKNIRVYSDEEFHSLFEFLKEDDYEYEESLYREVDYDKNYSYEPKKKNRRKNAS